MLLYNLWYRPNEQVDRKTKIFIFSSTAIFFITLLLPVASIASIVTNQPKTKQYDYAIELVNKADLAKNILYLNKQSANEKIRNVTITLFDKLNDSLLWTEQSMLSLDSFMHTVKNYYWNMNWTLDRYYAYKDSIITAINTYRESNAAEQTVAIDFLNYLNEASLVIMPSNEAYTVWYPILYTCVPIFAINLAVYIIVLIKWCKKFDIKHANDYK